MVILCLCPLATTERVSGGRRVITSFPSLSNARLRCGRRRSERSSPECLRGHFAPLRQPLDVPWNLHKCRASMTASTRSSDKPQRCHKRMWRTCKQPGGLTKVQEGNIRPTGHCRIPQAAPQRLWCGTKGFLGPDRSEVRIHTSIPATKSRHGWLLHATSFRFAHPSPSAPQATQHSQRRQPPEQERKQ